MSTPLVEARNASLVYHDQEREVFACRNISVTVYPNEFLGILGPSGSGKSSLLYLLSGLKIPTDGDVFVEEKSLRSMSDDDRSRLRISQFGFVFQQPYLLGYLSALENIVLAAGAGNHLGEGSELLDRLGLLDKAHRRPHELSGGERQRVCVARALLGEPKVIFADEPTASLDHRNGEAVVRLLNQHRGEGSLVMVTHDSSMLEHADRVIQLVDGVLVEEPAAVGSR